MNTHETDPRIHIKQMSKAQQAELASLMGVSIHHVRNIGNLHRSLTAEAALYLDVWSNGAIPLNTTAPNLFRVVDQLLARRLMQMEAANDPQAQPPQSNQSG